MVGSWKIFHEKFRIEVRPSRASHLSRNMKKKFEWGAIVFTVLFIFIIRFGFLEGPARVVYLGAFSPPKNNSRYHENDPYDVNKQQSLSIQLPIQQQQHIIPPQQIPIKSPISLNFSAAPLQWNSSLGAWGGLERMLNRSDLPVQVVESFREGVVAWESILPFVEGAGSGSSSSKKDDKQCPDSVDSTGADGLGVPIPCGLILDSSITIFATPWRSASDFQIELIGSSIPGESGDPPIILHYNVRFRDDPLTDDPVIIQNTWTSTGDWGDEERCPSPVELNPTQVDGFDRCIEQVGTTQVWKPSTGKDAEGGNWHSVYAGKDKAKPWFPFVEGMPFAATIWAGWDGFHVTVNGRHIASFEYRQGHEPALVGKVEVKGDLKLASIFATGLPMSEHLAGMPGLEDLKAPPLRAKSEHVALFIGVFSSSSNFDRRMAQRKSWMQFDAVRSGEVVVRFFVGLHTQEQVNKELWEEATEFGDLQLLPFVDYYHLITLKTAAICIFATHHVTADFVMKTDDDTFVRVDVVLSLIQSRDVNESSLLGEVEMISSPSRDPTSKWYITFEEWPGETFPPWAHGPGYIFSSDIAEFVSRVSESSQLQVFKLEDVSMGIWIDEFQRSQNKSVEYLHNSKFVSGGCEADYVTSHYQTPREMLCLWDRLQKTQQAICC